MAIWLFNVQLWTIILGLFILTSAARSADLEILGRQVILSGEIVSGDAERFRKSIEGLSPGTIVRLQSPGGLAREGIAIGRTIRQRKFVTYAPYGFCASACGLTWLGGVERWINPNAKVGFHQVYTVDGETNQASGVGNALVGAYMNELGYSEEAIILATVMKPDGMAWLNRELAARVDLDFQEGAPPPGRNAQIQGEVATPKTVQDRLDRAFQLRQDGNFIESVNLFLNLAEQGNSVAQTQLGLCYFNGMGVPQNDNEATKWFSFAAAQGEPTGQLMYGIAFQNGWGVRQDDAMGIEWITKAAEQGLSLAQVHLAETYSLFSGNPTAAMMWFRRAAEQGNPEAQAQLSRLYRRGEGVGKDHIMAFENASGILHHVAAGLSGCR